MDIEKLIQKLMESNDFFDHFTKLEIGELLKCCHAKTFNDRDFVFREGTKGSEFYIIVSGSIVVTKKGKKIDIVREGECIGEMGALGGEIRSASAEVIGKATMLKVESANIDNLPYNVQAKLFKNITLLISNRLRKRLGHT
ncbi:Crp/Fnr family transcriptional regulator [Spirochaetota bacterium]